MPKVARITTRPGGRPSLLIVDPGAALGLSLARTVRRYGCEATIVTSVAHARATLGRSPVHLLIIHDTRRISASQLNMLRQHPRSDTLLPCVVLGATSSGLLEGGALLVQTPVETHDVMHAIKASLGIAIARRRSPTHSEVRRVSSFSIPRARGEFSMSAEPRVAVRRTDAPGPDDRLAYSIQSRVRETLQLPAVTATRP